jgi:glycosyltransferase involved in cell wall biosynthesis
LSGQNLSAADSQTAGSEPNIFKVLYLAHCTRDKGLFDAIDGVLMANRKLEEKHSPVSIRLTIAGNFLNDAEKREFDRQMKNPEAARAIQHIGFASGDVKNLALRESDLFCFPTCYANENQPVNLIEAMAFGLPILTSRWRSLPEMFPPDYSGLVNVRDPQQIADALVRMLSGEFDEGGFIRLRAHFLKNFTMECHLETLAAAIHSLETR